MQRVKGDYSGQVAAIVKEIYGQPDADVVESDMQGFCSMTYFVTFANSISIVLQFRPKERSLPSPSQLAQAKERLGALVPDSRVLMKLEGESIFVYEMTCIPGKSFSQMFEPGSDTMTMTPSFIPLLPTVAAGLGHLLGSCCVPGSRAGDCNDWQVYVAPHLESAVTSSDPLVSTHRDHYSNLLTRFRSGILDDLPMAITNSDVSPTNLMVSDDGTVQGLVDWEDLGEAPLGLENHAVFWLMGVGRDEAYVLHPNSEEIKAAFWDSFSLAIPEDARIQKDALKVALDIGAAISTSVQGKYNIGHFASLPHMLEHTIPSL